MTDLDPKALDAAIETENLDIGWPEQVERVITAYLATRYEQGWVEVEIGNGKPDWTMADHFVACLDRAVEAERARCAVIVASYVGENDPAAWRWAAEAIEQAAPAPIFNVVEQARDEEREACARDIDQYRQEIHDQEDWADQALHEENVLVSAADKIRSRSQRERA